MLIEPMGLYATQPLVVRQEGELWSASTSIELEWGDTPLLLQVRAPTRESATRHLSEVAIAVLERVAGMEVKKLTWVEETS